MYGMGWKIDRTDAYRIGSENLGGDMGHHDTLEKLRAAKTAHIRWRSYAQALVNGVPVDNSKVPVVHTDCEFGKWYYGAGQRLSHLPSYRAIEEPHEMLHLLYMKIFKLLFTEEKVTLFQKLVGLSGKLTYERRQEVDKVLDQLLSVSKTLVGAIEVLERDVMLGE